MGGGWARRIFVHARKADVTVHKKSLPDWDFLVFEDTMDSAWIQHNNTAEDLFVLHRCHPAKVPDRNLGMYQLRCVGTKLVLEDHPFCGKAEPWHMYFPYSYVDKAILGYPHSYAFRDASTPDPYEPRHLAELASPWSKTYASQAYGDDIKVVRVRLSHQDHQAYAAQKLLAFEEEATPLAVVRRLKKFVDQTEVMQVALSSATIPLLNLNGLWAAYQSGGRVVVVSDAKVDHHLETKLWGHIQRANTFMQELFARQVM